MLQSLIKEYYGIELQEKALSERKSTLKQQIIEELEKENLSKFTTEDNIKATLAYKETFTYTDSKAIVEYLKNNGYENMLEVSIKKTPLNAELRKETVLTENLKPYFSKADGKSLKIEKKGD